VTMSLNAAKNGAHSGIMRKAVLANGEDLWAYPPPEILEKLTSGKKWEQEAQPSASLESALFLKT